LTLLSTSTIPRQHCTRFPTMAASPSSSPRLPSPPPMAEDQLGPKSPIAGSLDHSKLGGITFHDGASRRIRPGTRAADMPEGPPLVPLKDIDTAFQLTEHLKALYNNAIHPKGSFTVVPIDRSTATRLAQPPEGVDKYLWLYELCRFLCQEVNTMIVALFAGDPPCSAQTCNEMRASEWQYLCAVHETPKPCCAIDYCCHTLDWAANILTSPKNFPSRLALATETGSGHQQLRQLTNIFRRVYRIFAHAWFQHRDMFWKVESKSGIYVFFKTVCDVYGLIPEDNYTVPSEAEGIESLPVITRQAPTLLKRAEEEPKKSESQPQEQQAGAAANITTATGHTTKRHRQTPSVDAGLITTVPEEAEEDEDKNSKGRDSVVLSKSLVADLKPEPATADEEKSEETVAREETEVSPEDLKAEAEAPAQNETEEAVDSSIGEVAEPAAPIESSEPLQSSSVLTSESQSAAAAPHEDKHDLEEQVEKLNVSESQASEASESHTSKTLEAQESHTSKTSEPPTAEPETSEIQESTTETTATDTPAKEETDKTTDKTTEPALHEPTVHQPEPHEPIEAAVSQDEKIPTKAAVEPEEEPIKKEKVEEIPSSTTEADEEPETDGVVSDPKADAKDAEEATKSVED
jgi:hypothetical protein